LKQERQEECCGKWRPCAVAVWQADFGFSFRSSSKINFNFVANQLQRGSTRDASPAPPIPLPLVMFIGIVVAIAVAVAFTQRFHVKGDDLMRQSKAEKKKKNKKEWNWFSHTYRHRYRYIDTDTSTHTLKLAEEST